MTSRPIAVATALVVLLAGVAGCAPKPVPMPTPSGTQTPSASSTPTQTQTPSASPTVDADDTPQQAPTFVSCKSLLTSSLAAWTTGGISIVDEATTSTRLHKEGDPFALFFDAGGVVCVGSTGYEVYGIYSWGPIKDAAWAAITKALKSEGWSEQVTDAGIQLTSPEPGPLSICYYRPNQFGGCAPSLALLDEVFANAP